MKRIILSIVAASALTASAAYAGYKSTSTVTVNSSSRYAFGSPADARNSADSTQFIGCYGVHTTGDNYVVCSAEDSMGQYLACSTRDAGALDLVHGINGDSYLYFTADGAGNCLNVFVENESYFTPKAQ